MNERRKDDQLGECIHVFIIDGIVENYSGVSVQSWGTDNHISGMERVLLKRRRVRGVSFSSFLRKPRSTWNLHESIDDVVEVSLRPRFIAVLLFRLGGS